MDVTRQIVSTDGYEWRERMPDGSKQWYAFSRLGTADGKLWIETQTQWTGFGEARPFREHRAASPVWPDKWRALMLELHELPITVQDSRSMLAWMLLGGEALVEESLARKHYADRLAPSECAKIAGQGGWVSTRGLPKSALQHAPSPKVRTAVLLRDSRRCRMCGRTPEEDPHAFLEAHHGVPWGDYQSGLTVEENLFTICNTCHRGVSGGQERQFLRSIGVDEFGLAERGRERYFEGVALYRKLMSAAAKHVRQFGLKAPTKSAPAHR